MVDGALAVVLRKELLDALRDRRSLGGMLVYALVVGPAVISLVFALVNRQVDAATDLPIPVAGIERAPGLARFLERQQVRVEVAPPDFADQIRDGALDVVVEVPEAFPDEVAAGQVGRLRLHVDDSRDRAQAAVSRARQLLAGFDRQWGAARLVARGVSPEVAAPTSVETVNHATPQQSGSRLLFLLGFFAVTSTLLGGLAPALDASAGEREHGSLEPLLATPVSPLALAVGKWLAVALLDLVVTAVTLLGFAVTLRFGPVPKHGMPMVFGAAEAGWFLVLLAPLAALFPAIQLTVGSFGRTVKEAQTNHALVLLAMQLLPLSSLVFPGERPAWLDLVPVAAHTEATMQVLRGEPVTALELGLLWGVPALLAAACLGLFAWRLGRESLLASR